MHKREEISGDWRKLHNEKLHDVYSSPDVIRDVMKDELGGECGTYEEEEKCFQGFDGDT
jgi:hypothetical protein